MGVGYQPQAQATSIPGEEPVPILQEAGWAPEPVWTGAKNLAPPPGFDPRTVQTVASRYTDYATRTVTRALNVFNLFIWKYCFRLRLTLKILSNNFIIWKRSFYLFF